jgi:hypothetical protein
MLAPAVLAELVGDWASLRERTEQVVAELLSASELPGVLLFEQWRARHEPSSTCPGCGQDLGRTGVCYIVYTFEVCRCGEPQHEHLVEQAWHRACFRPQECNLFTPFWVRGVRGTPGHYTEHCQACGRTQDGHLPAKPA